MYSYVSSGIMSVEGSSGWGAVVAPVIGCPRSERDTSMDPVATYDLPRLHLNGDVVESVRWSGAFVAYGGQSTDQTVHHRPDWGIAT